jgi:hypothetical protein
MSNLVDNGISEITNDGIFIINMKYIIAESRMENLVFKFLDTELSEFETIESDYGNNDIDIQFFVPNQKLSIMRYNDKRGTLHINNNLINSLSNLFSLDYIKSSELIANYMEKNFKFKITELS